MGIEIEKKFLLANEGWRRLAQGTTYRQGYLNASKERTVRVRTIDDKGYLTIKGKSVGATRMEFEYEIPVTEAKTLLEELCLHPIIHKKRYTIEVDGNTWEVDEFFGENKGLLVAEIELQHEEQAFKKPSWIGKEVTTDIRYYNSLLSQHPYSKWKK